MRRGRDSTGPRQTFCLKEGRRNGYTEYRSALTGLTATMQPRSILDFFLKHVEERPTDTAALEKKHGAYQQVTWQSLWDRASEVGAGLVMLGLDAADHACILSNTRLDWCVVDLGILAAGAVTIPIYPSNLSDECAYIIENSEARVVFTEDASQTQKILEVKSQLKEQLIAVVQMTGSPPTDDPWVKSFADFVGAAKQEHRAALKDRREQLNRDAILTIIYTSGTTGRPKGVVLTHGNMLYEAEVIHEQDVVRPDDVQLLFLPMAHVFAKLLEVAWFATGHVLAFAESINTLKENLTEVRPTLMAAVPRVFEKFYAAVLDKGGTLPATPSPGDRVKHQLFKTSLELSSRNGALEERGEALGLIDAIQFAALKRVVFSKIGAGIMGSLGGRMRIMVSGGAPLSKTIGWFFRDAGITILEGYGMTETAAATTVNLPHANVIGSVGPAVPGTRVRIAEDGEIFVKGPGIMREYWRNPEATAETIDGDGWLHTGDIGEIDPRTSALRITDRKKDIIITAGGKNVAPQKIENLLKNHNLISQCVVHGDKRKYLSALIALDEEQLHSFAEVTGISGDLKAIRESSEVKHAVAAAIQTANGELASYETIKKYEVLPADFSIETGELTAKLSVKRKVVNKKFGHIFDSFYVEKF